MDYLGWLHATKHMRHTERGRKFNDLSEADQTEIMDSFTHSVKVTKRGNLINRFKGVK